MAWMYGTALLLGIIFPLVLAGLECEKRSSSLEGQFCTKVARTDRDSFVNDLLGKLSVEELARQLHLVFADNVVGANSTNELYDSYARELGLGLVHDWYPMNQSRYNELQALNLAKSKTPIPLMQTAECLHGVASFQQSIFPSPLGLSATFDPDMMYKVGRAIGSEARSIGVHACFAPVLDLAKDPRWGRAQEDLGEDFVLTTHMGVAFAQGLSKNSSWSDPDAVIPVMKHFAAHGSPQGGVNAAPYTGYGMRQIVSEMLVPFKAVVELGGARGVMMAYHDIDGVPSVTNPDLYDALDSWGFDGFVIGDDTAIIDLQTWHWTADSPAAALSQWFNAGGGVQYYDYTLDVFQSTVVDLVNNGTISTDTLRERARGVLNAKFDLGLFDDPYIPANISVQGLIDEHTPTTLEAAERSIVLLENKNSTLPLKPDSQKISKIALVGPMVDTFNFGDYSGAWGSGPIDRATTLRSAVTNYLAANASSIELVTSWGSNTWTYIAQYPIPRDLLSSSNGTSGGLLATYYSDTNLSTPAFRTFEMPNRQWGIYPPPGLPSNNFSAVWEGEFTVPTSANGWIGLAISPNSTATLIIDGNKTVTVPYSSTGTILGNIEQYTWTQANSTVPPLGCEPFSFKAGATHSIRVEYQVWNTFQKIQNVASVNAQVQLIWNPVDRDDPVELAAQAAQDADVVVFAGGAAWNSDGESGDRSTLSLSPNQTLLVDRIFELGKPIIMILEGGRPFAIPEYYSKAAAVMNAYFPGQLGGQALSNVLFGLFNPGGRLPLSIPSSVGSLPSFYNYRFGAHKILYLDGPSYPLYTFGYGLSYTNFTRSDFTASSLRNDETFSANDTITFSLKVANIGPVAGSDVPQVYLQRRISSIVQPMRQMVAFQRVYLDAGEERTIEMTLDPSRFLLLYTRSKTWEVEKGEYTFALSTSDHLADTTVNVTLTAV